MKRRIPLVAALLSFFYSLGLARADTTEFDGAAAWRAGNAIGVLEARRSGWDYGGFLDTVISGNVEECMSDAYSTLAMRDCYADAHNAWEDVLTAEYQLRLQNVGDQEGLREVQRAWIKYRDLKCAYSGNSLGSAGTIARTSCAAVMAKQRALEFIASNSCTLIEGCLW